MKVYGEFIFPRLMDWVMSGKAFQRLRGTLLEAAHGEVLEIGYGTGLNLCRYTEQVSHLAMIDPARLLPSKVHERVMQAPFPVHIERVAAELLPFREQRFDVIVSTWTLCSIPHPQRALAEIKRVLKPDGRLLFVEHGLSTDPKVQIWQHRLTPMWKCIGGGCHLNRKIDDLVGPAGFNIVELQTTYLPGPRPMTFTYQGIARPA